MKSLLTAAAIITFSAAFAQTVPVPSPVEEQYKISYWWWILGVLLAIGAGVIIYLLIKKDPRRDAVR